MRFLFITMVCLTIFACTEPAPKNDTPTTEPEPTTQPVKVKVVGEWTHSSEEDTETEKIYRGADFDFPPARARESITFNEDKTLLMKTINPDDTLGDTVGTWDQNEVGVNVTLKDEDKTTFTLLTSKLQDGILIRSTAIR